MHCDVEFGYQHSICSRIEENLWAECIEFLYKNSVRTSQERHYVSATKPNRLMLFKETVPVYCKNHTKHTDTLCGQSAAYINSVRTSQETHCISATKPNRLMLFRETVAVYYENHMDHLRSQRPRDLRHKLSSPFKHRDRGLESHSRHGCLCSFILRLPCCV
jgi:hypothetical protein